MSIIINCVQNLLDFLSSYVIYHVTKTKQFVIFEKVFSLSEKKMKFPLLYTNLNMTNFLINKW